MPVSFFQVIQQVIIENFFFAEAFYRLFIAQCIRQSCQQQGYRGEPLLAVNNQ